MATRTKYVFEITPLRKIAKDGVRVTVAGKPYRVSTYAPNEKKARENLVRYNIDYTRASVRLV